MEEEEPHLLRLSRHASASSQLPPPQISPPQASWPAKIMSGLGQCWRNQKQSSEMQVSRAMVVSAAGTHIAILDGYQIIFLSRVNWFEHAVGSSASPPEAGFYTCGVWLEDLEVFAAVSSLKCIVILDITGKELSQTSLNWWKTNAQGLGIFAKQMQNKGGEEKYLLTIYASDCSIYQIEYGPEGFCGLGSEAVSHTLMKKMHPKEVICCDFNCDKSILAVAGLSSGKRFARSAGMYCLSLWRIKDFWRSVELLGYVDDLETEDCSVGPSRSLKLIMSPSCNYIALLDSGARLQLVNVKQSPNWTLQKMECQSLDTDGRSDDASVTTCRQGDSQSKFSYFEVASVSESKMGRVSQFESLSGVSEACWWSENALGLLKRDGMFVIASVPDLRMISKFCCGVLCDKICITYASQRCIFMLESISEEPGQRTMRSGSVVDLKRSGWRLVTMQEYTIKQLFKILLESADFNFALDLAERYKLEKDTVYKRQWLLSDWGLEAVQQTLFKIEDRSWVIKECLERVCPTMEAMHALLRHGLYLVDLCVGSGRLKRAAEDAAIGYFCLSRLRLLQYSDRLETYLGLSLDRYTSKDYEVFRMSPLLDVAVKLAESGKIGAVSLLYKRHVYSLTPFLFKILDAFPETLSPHNYAQLLPTLKPFSPYIIGRERDWVEEEGIIEIIKKYDVINEEVPAVHLSSSTEHVVNACIGFVWPSETDIAEWYHNRASTIDRVSGQLENALTLLDLGKQKGLSSLEDLWEDLSSLHWVTYNNSEADEDIEMNLSLQDWQQLTDYEKFQAMLQGVNESNVLYRLNERAVPFLNHRSKRKTGALDYQEQDVSFLVKWMKEIASKDRLQICATVVTEACKEFGSNKPFKSDLECIHAGLDCVYACPGVDQWDAMDTILSKLLLICSQSQKNSQTDQSSSMKHIGKGAARGVSFSMYSRSTENTSKRDSRVGISGKEGVYAALDKEIQQAIGHVYAGRLLSNYQVPKPIKFLENAQNDERGVKQLILLMLSKFGRRQPARSDAEWATMWDHLQRLQGRAFTFLNRQFLFMEYYSSLLKAGKFSLAKSQLKALGTNLLSPERAEAVIIQASRDYLFSASSLDSPEIEKARLCLNLVPESKNIAAELDYIDTVTIKLPALGVSLLPMQVKQTKDPMEIVRKALMSSSSSGDWQVDDVLDIARSLGLNSEDQLAEVKEAIARQAAASGHIMVALDFCLGLMRRGHGSVWDLCAALARGPELDGMSLQLRKELLGFAISHCDDTSIGQLLQTWKEIDLFERSIVVKEAMTVQASSGFFFEEGLKMEAEYNDLQHQEGLMLKGSRHLLCKVAHIGSAEDPVNENLISKDQKKLLHILCSHLPWLLQAADVVDSQKIGNWLQDDKGLVSKSVATMLLGLAHGNLLARDELLCYLAHVAMSRLSKDGKSLIGCGYLLNLVDSYKAADLLEQEMQHEGELTEACRVLNLALKYGALMQGDAVSSTNSPKFRRERLLMTLRQSNPSTVSGTNAENLSESGDAFWKQWQSKVLKRLDTAEHALELKPIIANFSKDQFISGDESYVKDTILSLVKSTATPKSFEPEQVSRVDQYQSPNHTHHLVEEEMNSAKSYSLNLRMLENKLKFFNNKYLKNLNAKERWLSIQTLMTATAMAVLEENGQWYEDDWKERLCDLLHFWEKFFEDILDDEGSMSREAVEALLELRVCCGSFEKLMQNNAIPGLQSREVIAKLVNLQGCEEERARFLKAMVSSGCPYRTVLFVWQNATENVNCDSSSMKGLEVSNIYVQVISSSIETCSVLCKSVPFEGCCLHLEPALKAVASLSKTIESDDEILEQGLIFLHEVRLCVWRTLCHFAENLDVPSFLRVWLLKLREAIVSGHNQAAAPCSFESYLKNYTVSWVGWDTTGLAGEIAPPLQHTIMALKSTELISVVWHDLTIKAEDLVSVEAATSLFHRLSANVEHAQHVDLLIKLLEEWGDIFGWERNASEENTTECLTSEEENEQMDADWGHADGWDEIWDESEEVMASSELVKRDSGSVNALHTCWKTALAKLISFGDMDSLLHSLDSAHLRNGRTVLTKEESLELTSLLAQENPASALKVSLLLPYEEAQDRALECLDNKIRVARNGRQEKGELVETADECLLILVLASGRFSSWIDDLKFSASFRSMCVALASVAQTGQFSSAFTREVVLPYLVASLTPTSQYTAACALVLQCIRVHPAFITWNGARAALDKFLKAKASMPYDDLDNFSVQLNSLSCISNSVHHLQRQLRETLGSALQFLSNISS